MKLEEVVERLDGKVLNKSSGFQEALVRGVIVSDLMSDVLVVDHEHQFLVTSLATDQAVRTAHLIDASALIVCNNKLISDSMLRIAKQTGVTLISTHAAKFEVAIALGKILGL
jgi:predicted transcriptional regulator